MTKQTNRSGDDRIIVTLRNRAAAMRKRGEMGVIQDEPGLLAYAYLDVEPRVTEDTARIYKRALVRWLHAHPGEHADLALDIVDPEPDENHFMRLQDLEDKRKLNLSARRGAQKRARELSTPEWICLLQALAGLPNRWGWLAHRWLLAGLTTGLCPHQWRTVFWRRPMLTVRSASSRTRVIDLSSALPEQLDAIDELVSALQELTQVGYDQAYSGVRNIVRRAAQAYLRRSDRLPTLYTARHTFYAFQADGLRAAFIEELVCSAGIEGDSRDLATIPQRGRCLPPARRLERDRLAVKVQ